MTSLFGYFVEGVAQMKDKIFRGGWEGGLGRGAGREWGLMSRHGGLSIEWFVTTSLFFLQYVGWENQTYDFEVNNTTLC